MNKILDSTRNSLQHLKSRRTHPEQLQRSGMTECSWFAVTEPPCGSNAALTVPVKAATCSVLATAFGWKNRGTPGAGSASEMSAVVAVAIGGASLPEGDSSGDAGGCALDGDEGVGCSRKPVSLQMTIFF